VNATVALWTVSGSANRFGADEKQIVIGDAGAVFCRRRLRAMHGTVLFSDACASVAGQPKYSLSPKASLPPRRRAGRPKSSGFSFLHGFLSPYGIEFKLVFGIVKLQVNVTTMGRLFLNLILINLYSFLFTLLFFPPVSCPPNS
jgi:hypothetical protein